MRAMGRKGGRFGFRSLVHLFVSIGKRYGINFVDTREITAIKVDVVEGDELPHRVEIHTALGVLYGAGDTLEAALMIAFNVEGAGEVSE